MKTDAAGQQLLAGQWSRHHRYGVDDDGRVRPRSGAPSIFDPWKMNSNVESREKAPWFHLAEIGQAAGPASAEKAVLAFVDRYGLLGILPHTTHTIALAPRWRLSFAGPSLLAPSQLRLYRAPRGWRGLHQQSPMARGDREPGAPVAPDERGGLVPHVIQHELSNGLLRETPIDTLARYFTNVSAGDAETYEYPHPLTRTFFETYCEPLEEIVQVAQHFLGAIESAQQGGNTAGLDSILATVSASVARDEDGRLRPQLVPGSLLGSLAVAAAQDLHNRWLRRCEGCGELYVGERIDTRFRSGHTACGARIRKRDQRGGK